MKQATYTRAERILQAMRRLMKLEDTINEKYRHLNMESSDEEIQEFFTLLVKNGYAGKMQKAVLEIRRNIQSDISELQEEFDKL